jgi:dolichyl-phosphate beta-glucosyltransferase
LAVKYSSCSIVIPAYNEAKRLPRTLQSILAFLKAESWDAEVIVVNDGSTDDTAAVVRSFAAANPVISLIDNQVNCGKGQSIRDGVQRASGDIILFADADDSTPIQDAEKLVRAIEAGADIAIGSRWVDRDLQVHPQPWYRRLNGRVYNLLLRSILGLDYKDTQNGFKAFARPAAKNIFALQRIGGWGFDAEVLYLAKRFGFSVREIPVEYTYYAEGSKIRPYRDGARMLLELLKVRWHAQSGAYSLGGPTEQGPAEKLPDAPL